MPYTQSRWSLQKLFPSLQSPELESAFQEMQDRLSRFEQARARLSSDLSESEFLDLLREYEEITALGHRLYAMAGLSFAADTQDSVRPNPFGSGAANSWPRPKIAPFSSRYGGRVWMKPTQTG